MLLKGFCKFLSSEKKVSKKTQNEYTAVALISGTDTFTCLVECPINDVQFGEDIECSFEFNTKYNNLKLVSYKVVKVQKIA